MTTTGKLISCFHSGVAPGKTDMFTIVLEDDRKFKTTNPTYYDHAKKFIGQVVVVSYHESRGTDWFNRVELVK